jgi:hypothetical protein
LPSFSAIVEWENAKLAGAERAIEMLRILISQAAELEDRVDRTPELIILHNRETIPRETIVSALSVADAAGSPFDVRIETVGGAGYYQLKNIGAQMAARDYVLLLDSDVLPEPGWLRELLQAAATGVEVVSGSTYVDPATFLGRAFASFWFFPLRSSGGGLWQSPSFYANNVLFQRDLFLRHRYPDLPLYRGQCAFLARKLKNEGIGIYTHANARVCHPPPQPDDLIRRALCEGHDRTVKAQLRGKAPDNGLEALQSALSYARSSVIGRADLLAMPEAERDAAMSLATAYARLRIAGARWTQRNPQRAAAFLGIPSGHHVPLRCRRTPRVEGLMKALTSEGAVGMNLVEDQALSVN